MGGNTTPTECRSNEEVCHVLPHGEPTNASQMSTSIPPSLSRHPLSHPSLPAPTLPPIAPSTHCHLPPHSNPPRLGSAPLLTHLPPHQHTQPEPYRTPHKMCPQRAATIRSPPPPSPTRPSTPSFPNRTPPTPPARNSTPPHPTPQKKPPTGPSSPASPAPGSAPPPLHCTRTPRATRTPSSAQAPPWDPTRTPSPPPHTAPIPRAPVSAPGPRAARHLQRATQPIREPHRGVRVVCCHRRHF